MRRLYLQIYLAVLGVLVLFALGLGAAFWHLDHRAAPANRLQALTAFAEASIPPPDAPPERLAAWATAIAAPFELDLTVFDADGTPLARAGAPIALPPPARTSRFLTEHGHGHHRFALALRDGRTVVVRGDPLHRPFAHFAAATLLLALATALAAYPIARRLTRRLETLKTHVAQFGAGRLALRVPVEGHDEIARLAAAWNEAAERIERLVADKTRLLGETSHELRTPLTRIRAALELIRESPRPELVARAERDLAELDGLIGELLVASRLEAPEHVLEHETVDLLALAAEEAAQHPDTAVEVGGRPCEVRGDSRLLRRALRNLLENAVRHGQPPIRIEVADGRVAGTVEVVVLDGGPGIPEPWRERIFEPFFRPPGRSSAQGGVGLGLSLVRQIAARHGGRVACEPTPADKTRFVLTLPRGGA